MISVYLLLDFDIVQIYRPLYRLCFTNHEFLRLILPALFSFAKVLRRWNAKYRSTGRLH